MPDSSTGGYLIPVSGDLYNQGGYGEGGYGSLPAPEYDTDIEAILQKLIVGLTGLPGDLVRPSWQPNVPKNPEPGINWCAIAVQTIAPDANAYLAHSGTDEGSDTLKRHEQIDVLLTFYGAQGQQYAALARDGFQIAQNSEFLRQNNMSFRGVDVMRSVPDLVNKQWVRRYDFILSLRREVIRTYAIRSLLSAELEIIADSVPVLIETIDVSNP